MILLLTIALCIGFFGVAFLEVTDRTNMLRRKNSKHTITPAERTEFDCKVHDQRSYELRLVEAGVITAGEVVNCGDKDCVYCFVNKNYGADRVERWVDGMLANSSTVAPLLLPNGPILSPDEVRKQNMARAHNDINTRYVENSIRKYGLRSVLDSDPAAADAVRPSQVPIGAKYTIDVSRAYYEEIIWTYHKPNGRQCFYRQLFFNNQY